MKPAEGIDYGALRRTVATYLSRWSDRATRTLRDDLAQEATIVTWRQRAGLRDPERVEAFARTVARRLRARALRRLARMPTRGLEGCSDDELTLREPACEADAGAWFQVAARRVPPERLLTWLDRSMARLAPQNAALLRDYYAGSSCRELADQLGVDRRAVKSRLHRGRTRLRELLEWHASGASSASTGPATPPVGPDCSPYLTERTTR